MATRNQTAPRRTGYSKVRRLIEEAFKIADEKAKSLADALYDSAIKGHVLSARMLIELAEGNLDVEDAMIKGPLRSLALRIEQEEQMPPEPQDAADETAVASLGFVQV
jgi:hypothetical protein